MKLLRYFSQIKVIAAIGFIAVLTSFWFIPGPDRKGAMIEIKPNRNQVQQGFEWDADIMVNSNIAVNSLDIVVAYPTDEVQVVEVSSANSRFETKIFEPMIQEEKHEVYFVQATLDPFIGNDGKVGTITFKAKKPAKPNMQVNLDSKIVAHDGEGTNVFQASLDRTVGEWIVEEIARLIGRGE